MADKNLYISDQDSTVNESGEKKNTGKIATLLATFALATSLQLSADESKIALNTPDKSPTASVPTAEKGGGQVIDTPYGPLSFVEIQKHPKKDEILDDIMTPNQAKNYNDWIKSGTQAANQEEKKIDTNIQAANQRIDEKKGVEQAANQKKAILDMQLIQKMNEAFERGVALKLSDKPFLEKLAKGEPPNVIAQKLLKTAKFV